MQTLETMKRRMDSAGDLLNVVRTMKTLAAVSIRQYEAAVESLTDYYATVELGLRMLLWSDPDGLPARKIGAWSDLSGDPDRQRIGTIVLGSDQGMCGQFNEQIARYAWEQNHGTGGQNPSFLVVGARAAGHLQELGAQLEQTCELPGSVTGITPLVYELLIRIDRWQTEHSLNAIRVFYNQRQGAAACQPHQVQLLPLDRNSLQALKPAKWPSRSLPMFTMNRDHLLSSLIRQWLFVILFRAVAESLSGENASRIASMQAAERNIQDKLHEMQSEYHQLRQTSITTELLDVVTGFEALGGA